MNLPFLLLFLISGHFLSFTATQACGADAVLLKNPNELDKIKDFHRVDKRSAARYMGDAGHFGFPLGEEVPPSQFETEPDPPNIRFMVCVDSWINNTRSTVDVHFNVNYEPRACSEYCMGRGFQISMLRGGECTCESFITFGLYKTSDANCDVPCPVVSMDPYQEPPPLSSSCGSNTVYSVYCNENGRFDCDDLHWDNGAEPTSKIDRHSDVPTISSPFCGRCDLGKSCMNGVGIIYPWYDYFPRNNPIDCKFFCRKEQRYGKTSGMEEGIRAPRRYSVLHWETAIWKPGPVPICWCLNDVASFERMDNDDKCTAPCPGEPDLKCGRKDPDSDVPPGTFYATIYCTLDDCSHPDPPAITSTLPTTTTDSPTTMEEPTTSPQYDDEDCTNSPFSEGCLATTITDPDPTTTSTISPEEKSSTEPEVSTTTSTTTPSEEDPPSHINCALECVGTEYSGRSWTVCSGHVEEKECDIPHSEGKAFWECSHHGQFLTEQPDYSNCKSVWMEGIIGDSTVVNDTTSALTYLTHLDQVISTPNPNSRPNYFGHEIQNLTNVLDHVVGIASQTAHDLSEFEPVAQKAVGVTKSIITVAEPWHQLSQEERSLSSTDLLQMVEDTSLLLALKVPLNNASSSFYEKPLCSSPNYLVVAGALSKTSGGGGINSSFEFPGLDQSFDSSLLKLPPGWKNLVGGESIQFVGMFLNSEQANLMLPGQYKSLGFPKNSANDKDTTLLNGKLMSFTIGTSAQGTNVKMRSDIQKSSVIFPGKGVEIVFHHDLEAWGQSRTDLRRKLHSGEKRSAVLGSAQCAYWDTEKYVWSTKGCKTLQITRHQTVCECEHLTSFAVLMDVHNYLGKDLGLEILTILLCSLSFLCLVISVTIFSTFHGIQSERNSITKNLSICLLLGNTMVLLVLDRNYFNMSQGFCVASGIITHYVFLAAFAWMGVEGIHLYRMVVHVFDSENNPLNMYRVMAYGVPLILVILTTMIGYLRGDRPYGGDVVCWLNGSYVWSFLVPVVLVVVANLIILFIALKTAYQVQYSSQKKVPAFQNKIRSFRIWLRGCLSLTILLGVTWLLGFFTLVPNTPGMVAAYLFTIFNASQGIFIFIFHCVYNDKIRLVTYQRVGTYLPSWLSSSLQSSRSSSNSSYPSDAGNNKRGDSRTMKHSASDSSLSSRHPQPEAINYSINPGSKSVSDHLSEKRKLSPKPGTNTVNTRVGNDYTLDFERTSRPPLPLPGAISIIGGDHRGHPQVVNRRGSLIRQSQHWDSFGTVSSIDSVRIPDDLRGGSLSDSSCAGGHSTDNSERALIR